MMRKTTTTTATVGPSFVGASRSRSASSRRSAELTQTKTTTPSTWRFSSGGPRRSRCCPGRPGARQLFEAKTSRRKRGRSFATSRGASRPSAPSWASTSGATPGPWARRRASSPSRPSAASTNDATRKQAPRVSSRGRRPSSPSTAPRSSWPSPQPPPTRPSWSGPSTLKGGGKPRQEGSFLPRRRTRTDRAPSTCASRRSGGRRP
mmetsp:Transcript_35317/g.112920  ORF Transcript_35317/g.112920 Transcript_35317/m.112920 type:complete len:206 (+) Transcript_35317:335-952(+)